MPAGSKPASGAFTGCHGAESTTEATCWKIFWVIAAGAAPGSNAGMSHGHAGFERRPRLPAGGAVAGVVAGAFGSTSDSSGTNSTRSDEPPPSRRSRAAATSAAEARDGSTGRTRNWRAPARLARSIVRTVRSITAYCSAPARITRLLLSPSTRITGAGSPPADASSSKMPSSVRATSAASAACSDSTRTDRAAESPPPEGTSSWRTISSAAARMPGVAEITTALSRGSAATRSSGACSGSTGPRRLKKNRPPKGSAGSSGSPSSRSTIGATASARACWSTTVRTRWRSGGPPASSIPATSCSMRPSCDALAVTTTALLEASGTIDGATMPGVRAASAAIASRRATDTCSARASRRLKTRTSTAPPTGSRSSCSMIAPAIAANGPGALTSTRPPAGSAVTAGSATGSPASRAASRSCGQRERSRSIACTVPAITRGSADRRETTASSIGGATTAAASRSWSRSITRATGSGRPATMMLAVPGSASTRTCRTPKPSSSASRRTAPARSTGRPRRGAKTRATVSPASRG